MQSYTSCRKLKLRTDMRCVSLVSTKVNSSDLKYTERAVQVLVKQRPKYTQLELASPFGQAVNV